MNPHLETLTKIQNLKLFICKTNLLSTQCGKTRNFLSQKKKFHQINFHNFPIVYCLLINCKQTAVLPHLGHSSFLADLQKSKFIIVNSFYLKKFHNFQSFNLPSHLFGIDIRLGDGCISTHCDFFDVYDIFCKIQN